MQLPPLNEVAAALRKITEVLALELAVPSNEAPHWTEFEWQIARAVAAMHGMSSVLDGHLRWEGPGDWKRFLGEQRRQSLARHLQISGLLNAIDSQARGAGLAVVALKGAALHASNIYAAGERPMGDVDLLVRDEDMSSIARVLGGCNYAAAFTTERHRVFRSCAAKAVRSVRLGEHVDSPINVEVHSRIAEHLPVSVTDITPCLLPRAAHAGLNPYPSAAALMMHLLLHAAGNMRARALRLIQLHDIALLAERLDPGDWEALLAARPDGRPLWWAAPPLMLTARYYPAALPPDFVARLKSQCPWLLRRLAQRHRLADVSWSNIRVEAFPGLEWSRSPQEGFAFIKSRIWPSREARLELEQGAAQIPGSASIPWYGISHGARMLRWVFSRVPRVQTLLSVRAALDQSNDDSVFRSSP